MSYTFKNNGSAFKNRKLYFFNEEAVWVLAGYPVVKAWQKTSETGTFRSLRPYLNLRYHYQSCNRLLKDPNNRADGLKDSRKMREARAFSAFFKTFPENHIRIMRRYPSEHWAILALLSRCPASEDLADNPALLFALASNHRLMKMKSAQTIKRARSLIKLRRRKIVGKLGFPATDSVVRIFRKIDPDSLDIPILLVLRLLLGNHENQLILSHLPRLNSASIRLLYSDEARPLCSHALLMEIANKKISGRGRVNYSYLLRDSFHMWEQMKPREKFPIVRSISRLKTFHDELMEDFIPWNLVNSENNDVVFPPPPIAGNEQIIPINSSIDLAAEGFEQHNCVGSYDRRVIVGNEYIYKVVTDNDRATLSIIKSADGGWSIGQLLAARNQSVKFETAELVKRWIINNYIQGESP